MLEISLEVVISSRFQTLSHLSSRTTLHQDKLIQEQAQKPLNSSTSQDQIQLHQYYIQDQARRPIYSSTSQEV